MKRIILDLDDDLAQDLDTLTLQCKSVRHGYIEKLISRDLDLRKEEILMLKEEEEARKAHQEHLLDKQYSRYRKKCGITWMNKEAWRQQQ